MILSLTRSKAWLIKEATCDTTEMENTIVARPELRWYTQRLTWVKA